MTASRSDEVIAEAFQAQRGRLVAVAYRMLGSQADAEDAVQEAWLRLARQDADRIENLAGWLTTVVSRVCIDLLRSRKARPEAEHDGRLPELIVTEDLDTSPEDNAVRADAVGLALLVVLDSLDPAERLAFVLHDMFALPFEEIGRIIGRSVDASKMLASRARRKVQGTPRPSDDRRRQRAVVDAFLAASRDGDFEGLLRVLDPELTWHVYKAGGEVITLGATELADFARRGAHSVVTARRVLVNGEPGIAAWNTKTGTPFAVMACTVADGRIVEVVSVGDPERLAALRLPDAENPASR
jgi:RNA polymerase sigma factor (sigma-70 family)